MSINHIKLPPFKIIIPKREETYVNQHKIIHERNREMALEHVILERRYEDRYARQKNAQQISMQKKTDEIMAKKHQLLNII